MLDVGCSWSVFRRSGASRGRASRDSVFVAKKSKLKAGNRRVEVSNLDKVLYPKAGFTKADVIDYYIRVAPALLPHLRNRALTLKRYPDGVEGEFFYEKQCPSHRPPWVRTAA